MRFVESIKVVNGIVQNYDYHRNRAMRTTGIRLPDIVVPQEFSEGVVKCRILYTCCMQKVEYSVYKIPTINSLQLIEIDQNLYPLKYEDRSFINESFSNDIIAMIFFFCINNQVTDTSFCNLVFENDKGYFTSDSTLLAGTKRAKLIDEEIINVIPISIEDIYQFDRVHLINAMIELGEVIIEVNNIYR